MFDLEKIRRRLIDARVTSTTKMVGGNVVPFKDVEDIMNEALAEYTEQQETQKVCSAGREFTATKLLDMR